MGWGKREREEERKVISGSQQCLICELLWLDVNRIIGFLWGDLLEGLFKLQVQSPRHFLCKPFLGGLEWRKNMKLSNE